QADVNALVDALWPYGIFPTILITHTSRGYGRLPKKTMPCRAKGDNLPGVLYRTREIAPSRLLRRPVEPNLLNLSGLQSNGPSNETRPSSRVSHDQSHHDRWHRVRHADHLGQAWRHDASRHRPEVASGLDRRPAATGRSWWPGVALPEEIRGHRPQEVELSPGSAGKAAGPRMQAGALLFVLECRLEHAELPPDRVCRQHSHRVVRCMHAGVEPTHRCLQDPGSFDQRLQALRQQPDVILV